MMTREEAINHGKEQLEIFGGEHKKFIEIAIEALKEQRPLLKISKPVDLEGFEDIMKNSHMMFITTDTEKIELIREQQWIPCSERLPEYANFYLTSTEYDGVYCDFWDGYNFNRTEKIIAWMPLPEPYKAEKQ